MLREQASPPGQEALGVLNEAVFVANAPTAELLDPVRGSFRRPLDGGKPALRPFPRGPRNGSNCIGTGAYRRVAPRAGWFSEGAAASRRCGDGCHFRHSRSSARADLKLCNATSSRLGVAIGYQDQKGWATEGWWNIPAQTCETLLKAMPSRFIYVHAVDYDRGGEWGGTNFMCTSDDHSP